MKKLSKITSAVAVSAALLFAGNATAGVSATAFLQIDDLFALVEASGDGMFDENPTDYITITGGSREGTTDVDFNGDIASDQTGNVGAVGTADAALLCKGPDCAGNVDSLGVGVYAADDTLSYALADELVSGSALGAGASGFTLADVGIASGNNVQGNANSNIDNNILTSISFDVSLGTIDIRLGGFYTAFIDSVIDALIAANPIIGATANATASFSITLTNLATGNVTGNGDGTHAGNGLDFTDNAFDATGANDATQINESGNFFTDSYTLTQGSYLLQISQQSDVSATLVPEPATLALFGLGLLGLTGLSRRKA